MNYQHKYRKYKLKYSQIMKQIGGFQPTIINIDKFKPLFKTALELDFELGFNMFYQMGTINFEVSKGSIEVTIPYKQVVGIHTHPKSFYPHSEYQPPSSLDYKQSLFDHFKFAPVNVVIETAGMWIYTPNSSMIKEILKLQPNIVDEVKGELVEGQKSTAITINNDFYWFLDIIETNSANEAIRLNMSDGFLDDLADKKQPLFRENWKNKIRRVYQKIDLAGYIKSINHVANVDMDIGFDITFVPWSEPFNISVEITAERQRIFDEINARGLNKFDEKDIDIIKEVANNASEMRILRKQIIV